METLESSVVADKNPRRIIMVRNVFSGLAAAISILMTLCLILLGLSQILHFESPFLALIFEGLRYGAVGLLVATVARFFLDIMYGIFGLLQVKVADALRWFAFSLLSLVPLAFIFALMRLAEGFRA